MTIGVRAHDYGKQPVGNLLRAIADDGWQAIQLAFPKAAEGVDTFAGVTPGIIKDTMAGLAETGLSVAVLGVYVEPSLTDETARKEQSGILYAALPQAKELGAGCVGTETTSMRANTARNDALSQLRRSLEELLPEAERLGVNLALEPVHHHTLNTPELTRELLREMSSPRLKVIFDPVNLLRPEDIDAQEPLWARCIDCFGEHIIAVHIKGASREAAGGILRDASFADSAVNHQALFHFLRELKVPILREMAVPSDAERDIAFLRSLM